MCTYCQNRYPSFSARSLAKTMGFTKLPVLLFIISAISAHTIINVQDYLDKFGDYDDHANMFSSKAHPDAGLTISEFIKKYDYPFEEHPVTTDDGYILTMHRIPRGKYEDNSTSADPKNPKPVVLIMHGLLSSSMDFVNMGPGKSIGLLLADEGYDVWLGNNRGNTNSRAHKTEDPDDANSSFWDFSFHEMGTSDLPAKIDYILKETGASQISYVGHSQGTCQFFILTSEKPEYNDKINVMVALAPVAYVSHIRHPILLVLKDSYDKLFELAKEKGVVEFLRHTSAFSLLVRLICPSEKYGFVCPLIVETIAGFDSAEFDSSFASVILSNAPAGASVKQLVHFAQGIKSGKFRQYDHGVLYNLDHYNSSTPPEYDLSKITTKIVMFDAQNDWLATPKDIDVLEPQLQNVIRNTVDFKRFSHGDFLWAKDIYSLLNIHVMEVLNDANGLPPPAPISTTQYPPTTPSGGDDDGGDDDGGDDGGTTPADGGASWIYLNFALLVTSVFVNNYL